MAGWEGTGGGWDGITMPGGTSLPRPPDHYVPRPRLHRRLDAALEEAKVIQMVAPVVSGKTTLLSGWHASGTSPALAYVLLESGDDNLGRFWFRTIQAVQRVHPGWRTEALDDLSLPTLSTGFLDALIDDLAALDDTILVLDGLEVVHRPVITKMLGDFLVDLPRSLQVILSGRSEPHLRQGLLRARGQLAEIHASELAFDTAELQQFLERFGELEVEEDDAELLRERTEGWVGGTKLAALALRSPRHGHDFIATFTGSNRYVADLLAEEVLETQPDEVQSFLLATSVLDYLDESLCDLVTDGSGSAARLDLLERSGMFVESIDDQRSRYRYQPLFGDFLRHQLHRLDPDRERTAHRAAAEGYERRGEIGAAIRHFVAAVEPADAVRLVVEHGQRFAAMGRVDTLRRWLASWPDDFLTNDLPQMLEIARLCVMAGMRDEAVLWLARTRWRVEATRDPRLQAEHALLSGFAHATLGNLEGAVSEAHRVLAFVDQALDTDDGQVEAKESSEAMRGKAHHLLAGAYAGMDEFDAARRHRDMAQPEEEGEVPSDAYSAWLAYRCGDLDLALGFANQLLARSSMPWQWGTPLVARGAVRRERNQLGDAEVDLVRALKLSRQWSRPRIQVFCAVELAMVRFAQGRSVDAFEMLTEARPNAHGPMLRQRVDATHASLLLRDGDVERAVFLRREITDARLAAPLDVRLALIAGQDDNARQALALFQAETRSRQDQITVRLLRARLALLDDEAAAQPELAQAIELGRDERFVQIYAEDLPLLDGVMRRLLAEHDDPYAHGLLAAIAERPATVTVIPALVEPLSAREEIVLRYLQTSLSNREIALELHMSVNTLKTHLKSIYRKLGVGSRAAAVASARQLRWM